MKHTRVWNIDDYARITTWWNWDYVDWNIFLATVRKKIGMRERQLIMVDHNQYSLAGVVYLIREIVRIILLIEIVGGLIFTVYIMRFYDSFGEAFLNGLFMSVSATTNTGFDLHRQVISLISMITSFKQ